MIDEKDKPLGAPLPEVAPSALPTNTPQQLEKPKRNLNWKGFFFGIIVVVLIEWFAVKALNSGDPYIIPSLSPSKTPPSPTITTDETANWELFTDKTLGFSFLYPDEQFTVETIPSVAYKAINIQTFSEDELEKNLDTIFQPSEFIYLKAAIQKGTQFSSLQPGQKDAFKTTKLGTNYFVRIYPIADSACNCDQIKYITIVKNSYVVISLAAQNSLSATPMSPVNTKEKSATEESHNKRLLSDKETAIVDQYGDIEKILTTFKTIN